VQSRRSSAPYVGRAGSGAWTYYSNTTRYTYLFNNTPTTQQMAEFTCQAAGGHLLSYTTQQEQREVEQYFINSGSLMPAFHGSYWIGLRASRFPEFGWVDATVGPLGSYQNWGPGMPATAAPPNMCGGVNMTSIVNFVGSWMNPPCTRSMPFMCR
jgi:hypothetical protein